MSKQTKKAPATRDRRRRVLHAIHQLLGKSTLGALAPDVWSRVSYLPDRCVPAPNATTVASAGVAMRVPRSVGIVVCAAWLGTIVVMVTIVATIAATTVTRFLLFAIFGLLCAKQAIAQRWDKAPRHASEIAAMALKIAQN
jgi:hypothetical protein